MSDEDDARTAVGLTYRFWRALANGDDAALPPICFYGFLHNHGGPGPGIADRLRQLMGLDLQQCAAMGVTNMVRKLDDGGLVLVCLQPRNPGLQIFGLEGPELLQTWPLIVYRTYDDLVPRIWGGANTEDGAPLADGATVIGFAGSCRVSGHITLEVDIPADGPIQ